MTERRLTLTPASSYLNDSGETLGVPSTLCEEPGSAVPNVQCGAAVHHCGACGAGVGPSLIRRGDGCPKCPPGTEVVPGECRNAPVSGTTRCWRHGGKSPNALAKAEESKIETKARRVLADLGGRPEPVVDVLQALEDLAGEAVMLTHVLRSMVADLTKIRYEAPGIGTEQIRGELTVYLSALSRAESILSKIAGLHLEERRVRVSELQAVALHSCVISALSKAEIAEPGRQRFVEALSQELKAVAPGSPLRPVA